jgi:hypothetical protein
LHSLCKLDTVKAVESKTKHVTKRYIVRSIHLEHKSGRVVSDVGQRLREFLVKAIVAMLLVLTLQNETLMTTPALKVPSLEVLEVVHLVVYSPLERIGFGPFQPVSLAARLLAVS